MLTNNELTRLMKSHDKLIGDAIHAHQILRIEIRRSPSLVEDLRQECWTAVCAAWPPSGPASAPAFIRDIAKKRLNDIVDSLKTQKRDHTPVPLTDEDDDCLHRGYFVEPTAEQLLEREDVVDALFSLGDALPVEMRAGFNAHLTGDEDTVHRFGHRRTQSMFRTTRRLLGLHEDYPADTGVDDIKDHLFNAVEQIEASRASTQETPCGTDPAITPVKNQPTRSGRAPMAAATRTSSAGARTPTARSQKRKSDSAHYRRREAFRSRATTGQRRPAAVARGVSPSRSRLPVAAVRRQSKGEPK